MLADNEDQSNGTIKHIDNIIIDIWSDRLRLFNSAGADEPHGPPTPSGWLASTWRARQLLDVDTWRCDAGLSNVFQTADCSMSVGG